MLLDSFNFMIFLAATLVCYYIIPALYRWIVLLVASIVFYMFAGSTVIWVPTLIILSTFFVGLQIEVLKSDITKNIVYLIGITFSLALLLFFKYVNFFISTFLDGWSLLTTLGKNESSHSISPFFIELIVPLGISYITFQSIGYLIEIKRGNQIAEKHLGHFATYIMFFPKLLAGPIERAHNFLPQLKDIPSFNYDNLWYGLKRIVWGLFKKLVIANRLSMYTDAVFNNSTHHSGLTLLIASLLYTVQMYSDFSGYTDMALGTARLFGFRLMENFNHPFSAKSVSDFWRKWHISLSSWVSDYIYNPIAINRRNWNKWASIFAALITFIILGFWHGANWCFIVFGLLQGIILSFELLTRKIRKKIRSKFSTYVTNVFCISYVFLYFTFSLIFFRANSISDAIYTVKTIFKFSTSLFIDLNTLIFALIGIIMLVVLEFSSSRNEDRTIPFDSNNWLKTQFFYGVILVVILVMGVFDGGQFIYFQF